MKEYDATEAAYKNGYKKGIEEVLADFENAAFICRDKTDEGECIVMESWVFEEIKKKYLYRCSECRHFVGCECFSGKSCDLFES
jgi:hypothetical protein